MLHDIKLSTYLGKSTFGMAVALDQGILKCISTDTARAVMRSYIGEEVSPALHRSSYAKAFDGDDAVRSWKETCTCLSKSVENLVQDAMDRKVSLVVEGVHVVPSKTLIDKWKENGGVAIGVLLKIEDPEKHKMMLQGRGIMTGQMLNENKKIRSYERIRAIQDEMMRLAEENDWVQIEQSGDMDSLEIMGQALGKHDSSLGKGSFVNSIISTYKEKEEEVSTRITPKSLKAESVSG
jgi:2-phosphoglycerate kinase